MNDTIRFEKHVQSSTFHNPTMGNKLDTQQLEVRRDPLTGAQSVFNPRLEDKVAMFLGATDKVLIEKLARESEPRCFLCGERWKEMTPTYPTELLPEGRLRVGEVVLFPNLFPVAQVHAVLRVGELHYRPLAEFDAHLLSDALTVSIQFARRLSVAEPSARYLTVDANYLGPAGASIAHPHFQIVGGDIPCGWMDRVLSEGRMWVEDHGTCYWADLVSTEARLGERFIAETGPVSWVAAFSPQGANEVLGVLPGRKDFLEFDDADVRGLAQGLSHVLRGYDAMGISTFNLALYSGPLGEGHDSFRCCLRVISRQNVYENYRTDDYFLQKLLRNELILTRPEVLASTMRKVFERG